MMAGDEAVDPDLLECADAHGAANHTVHGHHRRHGLDMVHAHQNDGVGEAIDLAADAEQSRVGEPQQFGRKGRVHLDDLTQFLDVDVLTGGHREDAAGDGGKRRDEPESPRRLGAGRAEYQP